MSQDINEKFEQFETIKQNLLDYFSQAQELIAPYKQDSESKTLQEVSDKLKQETFKTLVIGEFKRGKSTFINALLGKEVLPAYATPCTAVINEVKYDDKPRAVLHFNNPLPKELPKKISPEVAAHIKKYKSRGNIPPMDIPVDEIEKYVVIPDPGKDQSKQVAESPFALVELFWPLELCKNHVEVIDSPGLNEHQSRTNITKNYLSKADAVLFVMSCDMLASETEMTVVDSLRNSGFQDIFFICNRFDQVRLREQARVKEYALDKLAEKTSLKENGVFFVSSANALDAKLEITDPEELNNELKNAGFLLAEDKLVSFLTENRGKIKILQPGRELRRILLKMLDDVLPARIKMYDQKVEKLKENYKNSKPELQKAKDCQQNILRKVELQQDRFARDVRDSFKSFMREQINMVPTWLQKHEFKNRLSFGDIINLKPKIEKISKECMDVIQSNIESHVQNWQSNELKPLTKEFTDNVQQQIEHDLKKFNEILSNVKRILNLNIANAKKDIGTLEPVSTLERLLVGDTSAPVDMASDLYKSLIRQIGIVLAMFLLGLTNPIIIFAIIVAILTGQWGRLNGQTERIKSEISKQIQSKMREILLDQSEHIAEEVKAKSDVIRQKIDRGLENEIKSLEENVQAALKEMESQKGDMKAEIAKIEKDIDALKQLFRDLLSLMDVYL